MPDKKNDSRGGAENAEIAELRAGLVELTGRVVANENTLRETAATLQALTGMIQERVEYSAHHMEPRALPYVGEAVHFYTIERSRQTTGMRCGPYAALVLRVETEFRECDLQVYSPSRQPFFVPAVPFGDAKNLQRIGSDDEIACWWQFPCLYAEGAEGVSSVASA